MTKIILNIILSTLLCFPLSATAQSAGWEESYEDLYAQDDLSDEERQENFEILERLAENPININTATRDDLARIPFLSDKKIEDMLAYVYSVHGMKSLGELMLIESLDRPDIILLPYFIYCGSSGDEEHFPRLKQIFKYGKHQVLASASIPLYSRHGDHNGYLGYRFANRWRYQFSYGQYVKAGITASQGSGEPFFANKNSLGYDHYGFYLMLRNMGRLKALAIGHYKVSLGMGLIMNTGFSFGKLASLSTLGRSQNAVSAHAGYSSANYLQGAAATIDVGHNISVTAFASWRKIDATLSKDKKAIATILSSGYHRTKSELERKNNCSQLTSGGNIRWRNGGFHIGLSGVFTRLSLPLKPNSKQIYRRWYAAGQTFWNASIDYGFNHPRFAISGETATGGCHALATVNRLSFQPSSSLQLMLLQRFYSYKYYSLFGRSFASGGRVQNESGIFFGASWNALSWLLIKAYTDYAYFAWPRYRADASSHQWDNLVSAIATTGHLSIAARYRLRLQTKNNSKKTALINEIIHRGRLALTWSRGPIVLRTQADVCFSQYRENSFGWMATQSASWHAMRWLQLTGYLGYFHTDGYQSRLYSYERGPLYSFSFPASYGKGMRAALFARADFSDRLMIILKAGMTRYFDRDHISSGLAQIDSPSKTDIDVQLRWKF